MFAMLEACGFVPARYIGMARFWLSLAVYISAFSLFPVAPSQAAGDGVLGWNSGVAGYYGSAYAACNAQWEWAGMNNGRSRLIGASDADTWYIKKCNWTRFQYLCLQETTGPGGCGTINPSIVTFSCSSGYTRVFPGRCVPPPGLQPERPRQCYGGGGKPNPETPHPVILSTGAKVLSETDFASDDGRFVIARNYRSFPVGTSTSARFVPLGLAKGWQFNFQMELQLGTFSGTPSSPTGNVTLIAPDGSGYDFTLNSAGEFLPRVSSGAVPRDYKVEFVGTLPSTLSTIYSTQTEWKVTGPDDRVWTLLTFSRLNANPQQYYVGRPTKIVARDGYAWEFTYASDGSLSTIEDTFGRTATFTWNLFYVTFLTGITGSLPYPAAVNSIMLPDGTSVSYTYDPPATVTPPTTEPIEKLVGVTWRDASLAVSDSTTYHYEDTDFSFALTGKTDHRNVRVSTYDYDGLGRAVLTKGADDQLEYQIAYGTSGGLITRTVTNPLGRVTVYGFETIGTSTSDIRLVSVDGELSAHCPATEAEAAYGVDGCVSDHGRGGRVTSFVRDARGRPTEITLADGEPEEQQISVT